MADDDQKQDSAADPWADILSGDSGESQPDLAFSFDDAAEPANITDETVPPVGAAAEPGLAAPGGDAPATYEPDAPIEDDLVGAWLDEAEPVTEAIASDVTADSSAVEIGTGSSGVVAAEEIDVWSAAGSASDTLSTDAFTPSEVLDGSPGDAAVLAGAAAGAIGAGSAPRKAAKPAKSPKGGIGQMIGVVLGGVMAIPITLGILIWGFQKDPFKVTKHVPESVAFLLPQKFQPGFKKGGAAAGPASFKGSPLDALGTGGGPATAEPATDDASAGVADVADLAVDGPQPSKEGEPVMDDEPVVPGDGETFDDPLAAAVEPAAKPEPSRVDVERVKAEFERAAAEAAAAAAEADRKPLDAAVEEALTALATVEEVADVEDPSRKALLVDCYKALAKVAAELVMLERISSDAGRPLAEPPQSLLDIHGRLGRHREDLVRLGRNWLDYPKRPSDGVVLPVTFQAARRVGPYWSSKVTLAMPKGETRELTVLSRAEPAAVQGDAVVLTGMVLEGDVVWAADVRPLPPAGGLEFF